MIKYIQYVFRIADSVMAMSCSMTRVACHHLRSDVLNSLMRSGHKYFAQRTHM